MEHAAAQKDTVYTEPGYLTPEEKINFQLFERRDYETDKKRI